KVAGRPALKHFVVAHEEYEIAFDISGETPQVYVRTPSKPERTRVEPRQSFLAPWLLTGAVVSSFIELTRPAAGFQEDEQQILSAMTDAWIRASAPPPYAAAPIRAQPKRTYEPLSDTPRPQGDHVPMLLAQLYGQAEWEALREPLERFARASGLFEEII